MKLLIRFLLLLVPFATFAQSHPSHANASASPEIREVAEKYLLGSWSNDPDTCNPVTVWYWENGKLLGQFLHGGVLITRYELNLEKIRVWSSDPQHMVWSMELKSLMVQSGQISTIHLTSEGRNGGERRTLQSVEGQNTLIKEGVFSNRGTPTPRIFRCQRSLQPVMAIEGQAERDRLAADGEAGKRRQQELEQRLATEAREREKQAAEVEAVRRRQKELEAQLAALQSQAASRPPNQAASSRNQRRVALVIGNAQYKVSPLENPVNDATDVDRTLQQLGFQTTLLRNATLGQMREATRRFADQLQSADVALIYFAGHGVESNRKNYMIPVNADLKFEYELDDQAYNAGQWLDMLESIKSSNAERVNIVILDACRNNSLIGARSLGRGLGRMDAPTGTFLAYSTAPGKVAADGTGNRNSPFTRHLLTVMQQPGLPIEEAFKEVRRNVSRETNGAQVPWESTSLTGFFTFRQTR